MKRTILFGSTFVMAIAVIASISRAQISAYITRSIDRSTSPYHEFGYRSFRKQHVAAIDGVHSQMRILHTGDGEEAQFQVSIKLRDGAYSDQLSIERSSSTFVYPLSYDDLVPMALFIDSGGTSLYTAWELDELGEGFPKAAGFAPDPERGYIAIEFKNTRFREVIHYVDFCGVCLGEPQDKLRDAINVAYAGANVDKLSGQMNRKNSYINSDVDTFYKFSVTDGQATVDGEIIRFYWNGLKRREETVITGATAFLGTNELSAKLQSEKDEALREAVEARQNVATILDEITAEFGKGEIDTYRIDALVRDMSWQAENISASETRAHKADDDLAAHKDAFLLYGTLALLRSFKESASPDAWQHFMGTVRELADTHREPWITYTKAYCEVYADQDGC